MSEQEKRHYFTCPKCGSHYFGTLTNRMEDGSIDMSRVQCSACYAKLTRKESCISEPEVQGF